MGKPQFEELDGEREYNYSLIIDVMTTHHSAYEMSDIPMYLAKYQNTTLRSIADALLPFTAGDTDSPTVRKTVRLIRSVTGTGKERFLLTALKSMAFFSLEESAKQERAFQEVDRSDDSRTVSQIMEDTFKKTQIDKRKHLTDYLNPGFEYDADHHSRILKAQRVADIIMLDASVGILMDYYIEMDVLSRNIDLIEPVLPVIMTAAPIVYGKSRTLPDGSGLRPLLRAADVVAIATVCGSDKNKQEMVIEMIKERGMFDQELLSMTANAESKPLSVGIL